MKTYGRTWLPRKPSSPNVVDGNAETAANLK